MLGASYLVSSLGMDYCLTKKTYIKISVSSASSLLAMNGSF